MNSNQLKTPLDKHLKTDTSILSEANSTAAQPKEYAIEFENVSRMYRLHHEPKLTLQDRVIKLFNSNKSYEDFWALKEVSFKLPKGKTIGIIGQNGAGKSTLLKLATRILEPTSGTIRVNGRVSAMLELGTGFHPELSARDNIYLNGSFYGFSRKQMDERYERIVEFSELGKFIDTPVKHFSSGMYMRLGFAVAITVSPDILIIDEVLAVGDAAFGRKCHLAIEDLKNQSKAMLFVSHSAGEVSRFCDEVIYLANGQIVAQGKPGDVLDEYMIDSMGPSYFISRQANKAGPAAATNPVNISDGKVTPNSGNAPSNEPVSLEEQLLADPISLKNSLNPQARGRASIVENELKTLWQFRLPLAVPMPANRGELSPEYYLALLNPSPDLVSLELLGYKPATSLLDRAAGLLREVRMTELEIGGHQTLLVKLEQGALLRTNLLKLKSRQPVAAQLLDYLPPSAALLNANDTATPAPATRHYFPFCDVRNNNLCRFEVFNPENQVVELNLTLYRSWSHPVPQLRSYTCLPFSQLTIDLNKELAGGEGERMHGERFYGGVVLEATKPVLLECFYLQASSPALDSNFE